MLKRGSWTYAGGWMRTTAEVSPLVDVNQNYKILLNLLQLNSLKVHVPLAYNTR
jgi:hypothetical protein